MVRSAPTALADYDEFARTAHEGKFRHNLGVLKSIVGGTEIALRDPVDFDPRAEYWWLPERRFLVAYLVQTFPRWPPGDAERHLADFAVWLARGLDELRRSGAISFDSRADYERGTEVVLEPVRAWIQRLPAFEGWQDVKVRRDHAASASQSLGLFCDAVIRDGFDRYEPGIGRRSRWFAALGAHDVEALERRQRFFNAFRNAVMSHNSYRRAGGQFFGPIVSNTPTGVFLDVLRRWREGASREEAPLRVLGSQDSTVRDVSTVNVVAELWGFFNLHRQPFYNRRVALYQTIDNDLDRAVANIGENTRGWLASHQDVAGRLAESFDRQVEDPATESDFKQYAVRRWHKGAGSDFDRALQDELMSAAVEVLRAKLPDDKAAILLHLAMDAIVLADSRSKDHVFEVVEFAPGGVSRSAPQGLALRNRDRVWIYAPGASARNWNHDFEQERASIGYARLGDLRQYQSLEAVREALREEREGDAEPTVAARTCWRFSHELQCGDPIIAKRGRSRVVGIGIVDGDYVHVAEEGSPNKVPVRWVWSGDYVIQDRRSLPMATLSECSQRKNLLRELEALLSAGGATVEESEEPEETVERYSTAEALADLFIVDDVVDEMLGLLRRKKNIILQGPPGVGKTFVAKRLAYLLLGACDDARVRLVQFHQAYTYEQFVRGYRPDGKGGFELANGPLYELAETAKSDLDSDYVLIVDEINRGNLSKILGEGMMLLEPDKRSEDWALQLAYTRSTEDEEEEPFYLPPNLYVIGTMNTADRSLAVVDYALRRRFSFVDLRPGFEHPRFREHVAELPEVVRTQLLQRVRAVNDLIRSDANLGEGFLVGHSHFCRGNSDGDPAWAGDAEAWLRDVLRFEVLPLLREYWYDDPQRRAQAETALGLDTP